ncbi:hypothetical protein [Microbulbifer rhizosphaerae]|uniref:Uncharacterized protein n=1 Tax=Microbulbifer rhizosphaerae TaxID=1562603 RepID=A0A7W4ZAB0_9GAMM|nr:hypothetical protein [Microbulbifer rhizosphaerae]MBB3061075.1 hypothetical protein [Microbulbifer rhizosphaerae]
MEVVSVWLIYHKASLDELSPMNEDGSEYMVGTGFVPATSMKEAVSLFEKYLEGQKMEILELTKCEQFDPANFNESNEEDRQIIRAASSSLEDGQIRYVGISSEAMECDEGEDDD